jgi:iron(III) transport system substrate-binding protein
MNKGLAFLAAAVAFGFGITAAHAQQIPAKFADDPVAQALGPEIFNAALKEGVVAWYGSDTSEDFLKNGGKERFEKRYGIRIQPLFGRLRALTDRIRTEAAVGKMTADVFDANDQYMMELYREGVLTQWRPPAPELKRISPEAFVRDPEGYWWPVHVSAQGIVVNTKMANPEEIKSYWDIADPKFKGKVGIRDPRSSGGGAWHMLSIYNEPGLGIDYIKKLVENTKPFIVQGASEAIRDVVARGQFAIGFSGRGDFFRDLPKNVPLAWVVPKEGMSWTPSSITVLKNGPHPNASKVLLTWFYELPQLQLWTDQSRPVPHPDVKVPIPEMSVSTYPLMKRIPDDQLDNPNPFFKEMEKVFGIR